MRALILVLVAFFLVGCAKQPGASSNARPVVSHPKYGPAQLTRDQVRAEIMSMADTYASIVTQGLDELRANTKRQEVAIWSLRMKIISVTGAFTSVLGPNELVCLSDMVVFVTLKRTALEEHWIPNFLHEEGEALLKTFQRAEAVAMALAERAYTPSQVTELREIIEKWRRDHPGQYYVSHIRVEELGALRMLSPDSPQVKMPGSLFSLLYIDPLANLDPVAQELRNFRQLTERMVFMMERMPIVFGWQAELVILESLSTSQVVGLVDGTQRFAGATERFADTVSKYPEAFAKTSSDSIDQLSKVIAEEREAIARDLDVRQERLGGLLDEASGVIATARDAGVALNSATADTVTTTEAATRRTLDHAFRLCAILIILLLVGIPLSAWACQFIRRRSSRSLQNPV